MWKKIYEIRQKKSIKSSLLLVKIKGYYTAVATSNCGDLLEMKIDSRQISGSV